MNKLKKRILQISLNILKRHISKFEDIDLYLYNYEKGTISPLLYFSRYLNFENSNPTSATNEWRHFEKMLNYENKIVIDVGAAIGATVRLFSKKAKTLYAFEPQSTNFKHLKTVIKLEKLDNVFPVNSAVSDKVGTTTFYNRESHGIHSLGMHNKGSVGTRSEVKVTTLDNFCQKNLLSQEIALLKIDVEGFESDVLKGAIDLLTNKKIKAVIFEYSPKLTTTCGKKENDVFELLTTYGFSIYDALGRRFNYKTDIKPKLSDFLALLE